jgi:hypothetical protein
MNERGRLNDLESMRVKVAFAAEPHLAVRGMYAARVARWRLRRRSAPRKEGVGPLRRSTSGGVCARGPAGGRRRARSARLTGDGLGGLVLESARVVDWRAWLASYLMPRSYNCTRRSPLMCRKKTDLFDRVADGAAVAVLEALHRGAGLLLRHEVPEAGVARRRAAARERPRRQGLELLHRGFGRRHWRGRRSGARRRRREKP